MEDFNIQTLNISSFKQEDDKHTINYKDDDFIIINSLENIPINDNTIRLGFLIMIYCVEGRIQIDVNNKTYLLRANDFLLGLPNVIIGNPLLSPRHKIRLIGVSRRFLQQTIHVEKEIWNIVSYINNNPVMSTNNILNGQVFRLYRELMAITINSNRHSYRIETIQHLFAAIIYEVMGILKDQSLDKEENDKNVSDIQSNNFIFRKFMELLSEDNGIHRTVTYFANILCYSPSRLSQIVKQSCGRTPMDLIHETAIKHIKYRLIHTDKSIKEIADEFNFPNQSFFGKFVKSKLGMTPNTYRRINKK